MVRTKKTTAPAKPKLEEQAQAVPANVAEAEWKAEMEARIEKLEKAVKILSAYKVSKTQIMRDESYKLL